MFLRIFFNRTSTCYNSGILTPISLKTWPVVVWCVLFQCHRFHWIMICQEEMVATFPRCVVFGLFKRVSLFSPQVLKITLKNIYSIFYLMKNGHSIWTCPTIYVLPRTPVWDRLFGPVTNPNFHKVYLKKYRKLRVETWKKCSLIYPLLSLQVSDLETSPKKIWKQKWQDTKP